MFDDVIISLTVFYLEHDPNSNMADGGDKKKIELYNFLEHYNLKDHYEKLVRQNVTTISHLKATSDTSLREVGFSGPEVDRVRKKLKENFDGIKKMVIAGTHTILGYCLHAAYSKDMFA